MEQINITGGSLSQQEIDAYLAHIRAQNPGRTIDTVDIELDGEYVNLSYKLAPVPYERIRRITGYLVGTLDRFNNGKRAEERDRVKHSIAI